MACITLVVTNYLVNGQLPADIVCEWTDGLDVIVGASRNEFGDAVVDFHGAKNHLETLIDRYEEDQALAVELCDSIVD